MVLEFDWAWAIQDFSQFLMQEVDMCYSLMLSLVADSSVMCAGEVALNPLRKVGVPSLGEWVRFESILRSWMTRAKRRAFSRVWDFLAEELGFELWEFPGL